jgi:hypothetical protein
VFPRITGIRRHFKARSANEFFFVGSVSLFNFQTLYMFILPLYVSLNVKMSNVSWSHLISLVVMCVFSEAANAGFVQCVNTWLEA